MIRNLMIASCFGLLATTLAVAQDNESYGSVFDAPAPDEDMADLSGDDIELHSDQQFFEEIGFTTPTLRSFGSVVDQFKTNLVMPDYKVRNGVEAPELALIELAPAYLTGGMFNDVISVSHLPGDCGPDGCLIQIFSMDAQENWTKRFEFTALGVAYRQDPEDGRTILAAVGDNEYPSRIYVWDGSAFIEE